MFRVAALGALLASGAAAAAGAAGPCGPARTLPAVSTRDDARARPLVEALERGFRGVEVTVGPRPGAGASGGSAGAVVEAGDLEASYLRPLQDRLTRCGWILGDSTTFLIALDTRATTRAARLDLAALLGRYPRLWQPAGGRAPVAFVLVGLRDTPAEVPPELARPAGFNWNCTMEQPGPPAGGDIAWRMLTIDFRKTMGWSDGEKPTARARKLLRAVLEARRQHPGARIRVVNIPVRTAIVRFLLDQGVDLIAFDDLAKGGSLLEGSSAPAGK